MLLIVMIVAMFERHRNQAKGQMTSGHSDDSVTNKQNNGYVLKKIKQVNVATFVAKLVFHVKLNKWNVTFNNTVITIDR